MNEGTLLLVGYFIREPRTNKGYHWATKAPELLKLGKKPNR